MQKNNQILSKPMLIKGIGIKAVGLLFISSVVVSFALMKIFGDLYGLFFIPIMGLGWGFFAIRYRKDPDYIEVYVKSLVLKVQKARDMESPKSRRYKA